MIVDHAIVERHLAAPLSEQGRDRPLVQRFEQPSSARCRIHDVSKNREVVDAAGIGPEEPEERLAATG